MADTVPLQDLTALVRPELERVNRELAVDLATAAAELAPLLELAARYRGKQLRPALVLLAAKACGGIGEPHFAVAKVVELIHTASLVHDDILDDAKLRRQVGTLNALEGSEIAVLLGDYLYARAFQMAVSMRDQTCSQVLAGVTRVICQGEITQLVHRLDFDWTEDRYRQVIFDKTACLFGAAGRLGAHYAGAPRACSEALEAYGNELGLAFQIVDDCLDLVGDEQVVGKSLGTDLDKGKLTLPLLYLLRTAPDAQARLRRLIGRPSGMARLADEFDLGAARDYSLAKAREHVARAREALAVLPSGAATAALGDLAQFVVRREL